MTDLLDSNVLIAITIDDHIHHEAAERWMASSGVNVATCPITQGALLRHLIRVGDDTSEAWITLADMVKHPRHEFWPDDLGYDRVHAYGVIGHRQVTDAYLAQLARANGGRLVTFDRGLAALHPDVAVLVPTHPELPEQRNDE